MQLINAGHIDDDGGVGGASMGVWGNGTHIFDANGLAGLWAYTHDGQAYTNAGFITDAPGTRARGVWGNATHIFCAHQTGGLRAYTYAACVFTPAGNINNGGAAYGVVGNGVNWFLANWTDGLRAYTYNGVAFVNVGWIDDGALGHLSCGVAILGPYIILANGPDGVRAYTYAAGVFTPVGHIDDGGAAFDVYVHNGIIYVPNSGDGLRMYTFDGAVFHPVGHANPFPWGAGHGVVVGAGYVFFADLGAGFCVFTYDTVNLQIRAARDDGGNAEEVFFQGGILHLANAQDGMRAYKWLTPATLEAPELPLIIPETKLEIWGYDMLGPVPFDYRVYRGYAEDAYPADFVTLPFQSRMIAATISEAPADLIISYDGITAEPERRFDTGFGRLEAAKAFMIKNHVPGNISHYQLIPMI